jgi:hypothetical protein
MTQKLNQLRPAHWRGVTGVRGRAGQVAGKTLSRSGGLWLPPDPDHPVWDEPIQGYILPYSKGPITLTKVQVRASWLARGRRGHFGLSYSGRQDLMIPLSHWFYTLGKARHSHICINRADHQRCRSTTEGWIRSQFLAPWFGSCPWLPPSASWGLDLDSPGLSQLPSARDFSVPHCVPQTPTERFAQSCLPQVLFETGSLCSPA